MRDFDVELKIKRMKYLFDYGKNMHSNISPSFNANVITIAEFVKNGT